MSDKVVAIGEPEGTGQFSSGGIIVDYSVFEVATGPGWPSDELVFTIATTSDGTTGIRADSLAIPPGSQCVTSGESASARWATSGHQ